MNNLKGHRKRNVLIAGLIGVVMVCVWVYSSNTKNVQSASNKQQAQPSPQTTPTQSPKTPSEQNEPQEFVSIYKNFQTYDAGATYALGAKTLPQSSCSITVTYYSGPSHAQGLIPKIADDKGSVAWNWVIGTNTTPGSWPAEVTCSKAGKTGTDKSYVFVTNPNYSDEANNSVVQDAQLQDQQDTYDHRYDDFDPSN